VRCIIFARGQWDCAHWAFFEEGLLVEEGASPEEEWPAWSLGFRGRTARRRGSESKGMPASSLGFI
jgi:hypothetical protein